MRQACSTHGVTLELMGHCEVIRSARPSILGYVVNFWPARPTWDPVSKELYINCSLKKKKGIQEWIQISCSAKNKDLKFNLHHTHKKLNVVPALWDQDRWILDALAGQPNQNNELLVQWEILSQCSKANNWHPAVFSTWSCMGTYLCHIHTINIHKEGRTDSCSWLCTLV